MSDSNEQFDTISAILEEVHLERQFHLEKWGAQDHASYFGDGDLREFAKKADYYKAIWEARKRLDVMTWDVILLEEVYEAVSEKDDALRRAELVQVAAVAVAEIEAIDRRQDAQVPDADEDEDSSEDE